MVTCQYKRIIMHVWISVHHHGYGKLLSLGPGCRCVYRPDLNDIPIQLCDVPVSGLEFP
jgi:hypothetical protein